jgi:hypothetical protein
MLQRGDVTPCCILHWGVRSYRCKMQRGVNFYCYIMQQRVKSHHWKTQQGVKSYCCRMQRGVKSYRRIMQWGVNLAAGSQVLKLWKTPLAPERDNHVKNHGGTFTIPFLWESYIKTLRANNLFLTPRCIMQRGVKLQIQ